MISSLLRALFTSILGALMLPAMLFAQSISVDITYEEQRTAERLAYLFLEARMDEVRTFLHPDVRDEMTTQEMLDLRDELYDSLGKRLYIQQARQTGDTESTLESLSIQVSFEKGSIEMRIQWTGELRENAVTGFQINPSVKPTPANRPPLTPSPPNPPPYIDKTRFKEFKVGLGPEDKIDALLSRPVQPDGRKKGILLLPSMTMHDIDGTVGEGKLLRDLAYGLASRGYIVLRFRRRPFSAPDMMADDYTIEDDYLADARDAIERLSRTAGVDESCLYVLGLEIGGVVGLKLLGEYPELAGGILLNSHPSPGPETRLRELEEAQKLAPRFFQLADELDTLRKTIPTIKDRSAPKDFLVGDYPVSWWESLAQLKGQALLDEVDQDVYLLQGEKDFRIAGKANPWNSAVEKRPNLGYQLLPNLNRWMMISPLNGDPRELTIPGHVHVSVIDEVENFVEWSCQKKRSP